MDSAVGDELLDDFVNSNPRIRQMSNLQATIGLLHSTHIDTFNQGARRNAQLLTEKIGQIAGMRIPQSSEANGIYVYYPLSVSPDKRDDLRHYLLKHGIDTKITDMSDCTTLKPFQTQAERQKKPAAPYSASLLEICVYPVIAEDEMHRIAAIIHTWANLSQP
jgi:dTDP-4-amino-4,6-dideoxygalactose transaminase